MAEMMIFIDSLMKYFMGCFSTYISYYTFMVIVMGFLTRRDHYGVTSFIRSLDLHPSRYDGLLDFFRSKAVNLNRIWQEWWRCARDNAPFHRIHEKVALAGDDSSYATDAKKQPGVTKLFNYSGNSDREQYFWGKYWGAVGAICKKGTGFFCMPLHMSIQVGLSGLKSWIDPDRQDQGRLKELVEKRVKSHIEQMVENAYEVAKDVGESILILDRFYLSSTLLKTLKRLNHREHILDCVMRVKGCITAYDPPPPKDPHKKGRGRKKGVQKYVLEDLFDDETKFTETDAEMYGRVERIRIRSIDLVWGRGVWMPLRFVLTIRANGAKCIFASTDLTLTPVEIVEAYSLRYKIEVNFRNLKQVIAGFQARFWSKSMPQLNRFAKKDEPDRLSTVTDEDQREAILDTLEAYERFAALASVALGIAQMIAATPAFAKIARKVRWLRTPYPGDAVSEETVTYFFAGKVGQLLKAGKNTRLAEVIREYQRPARAPEQRSWVA